METLKSMKMSKREAKAANSPMPAEGDEPRYPWGLTLHLNEESLDKLGEDKLPAMGAEVLMYAKVKVTGIAMSESNNGKARSVSLQITAMCFEDSSDDSKHANVLFGASK